KPAAGDTRPTSCPIDRCADESPVPMSRVPQDSSRLAGAAASGEARRGLLVYAWRNRYPGWPNPNHSSSPCSFSFSMNSGASSMIRVLLSAPLCLHIRLSSRFTSWPDIWIVPEEIAFLAVSLASEDAGYVTGQCMMANGGKYFL